MPASSTTAGTVTSSAPASTASVRATGRSMPRRALGSTASRPGHNFTPAPTPISSPPTTGGVSSAATVAAAGAMSKRVIETGPSSATPTIQNAAPRGTALAAAPADGWPRRHSSKVTRASVSSAKIRKLVTYENGSSRGPAMTSAAPGGYCQRASANGAVDPCSSAADQPSYSRRSPRTSCWVPGRPITTQTRRSRLTTQADAQPMRAGTSHRRGAGVIAATWTNVASRSRYGSPGRWTRDETHLCGRPGFDARTSRIHPGKETTWRSRRQLRRAADGCRPGSPEG